MKWYALQMLVSQTSNTLCSLYKYDEPSQHSTCVRKLTYNKYTLYIMVTCRVLRYKTNAWHFTECA